VAVVGSQFVRVSVRRAQFVGFAGHAAEDSWEGWDRKLSDETAKRAEKNWRLKKACPRTSFFNDAVLRDLARGATDPFAPNSVKSEGSGSKKLEGVRWLVVLGPYQRVLPKTTETASLMLLWDEGLLRLRRRLRKPKEHERRDGAGAASEMFGPRQDDGRGFAVVMERVLNRRCGDNLLRVHRRSGITDVSHGVDLRKSRSSRKTISGERRRFGLQPIHEAIEANEAGHDPDQVSKTFQFTLARTRSSTGRNDPALVSPGPA